MSDSFTTSIIGSVFSSHLASTQAGQAGQASKGDATFSDLVSAIDDKSKDVGQTSLKASSSAAPTAAEKFMKYQNMSIAEKIRASYLSDMHLTEDDLKAMDPAEREKIEKKIADKIKEQLAKATGGSAKDSTVASSAGVQALVSGAGI